MKSFALKKHITEHEEIDSEGSWAISYGDMITLLLSFFIIFFTIEPANKNTPNIKLKVSLIETLNDKSNAEAASGFRDKLSLGKKNEDGIDRTVLKEWNGVAHDQGNHIIVEFPGVSFFNSAQTDLTNEGIESLQRFVKVYMPYAGNYFVSIRAFADKRALKSSRRYKDNLELTALRSVSTLRVLQKSGLPLSRIHVGGFGELILTAKELEALPQDKRKPSSELDLARTVILVIEPEVLR